MVEVEGKLINFMLKGNTLDKFKEIKALRNPVATNAEILRECIRETHKLLLG